MTHGLRYSSRASIQDSLHDGTGIHLTHAASTQTATRRCSIHQSNLAPGTYQSNPLIPHSAPFQLYIHPSIHQTTHPIRDSDVLSVYPSVPPSLQPIPFFLPFFIHSFRPTHLGIYQNIHPINYSVRPTIHLSIHQFTHLSICSPVHIFIHPSIHPFKYPSQTSVCPSVDPSVYLSIHLSVRSFIHSLTHTPTHTPTHPSIHQPSIYQSIHTIHPLSSFPPLLKNRTPTGDGVTEEMEAFYRRSILLPQNL